VDEGRSRAPETNLGVNDWNLFVQAAATRAGTTMENYEVVVEQCVWRDM
jgi:hypothetical protein